VRPCLRKSWIGTCERRKKGVRALGSYQTRGRGGQTKGHRQTVRCFFPPYQSTSLPPIAVSSFPQSALSPYIIDVGVTTSVARLGIIVVTPPPPHRRRRSGRFLGLGLGSSPVHHSVDRLLPSTPPPARTQRHIRSPGSAGAFLTHMTLYDHNK